MSAGSTGALLGAATLLIKRDPGIRRAALAPVVPTGNGGAVLIGRGGQREMSAGVSDPVRLYGLPTTPSTSWAVLSLRLDC